jgi:hypothetical protein
MTPSALQLLEVARKELAITYAAYFAGANISERVIDVEQQFITEWIRYYDQTNDKTKQLIALAQQPHLKK